MKVYAIYFLIINKQQRLHYTKEIRARSSLIDYRTNTDWPWVRQGA